MKSSRLSVERTVKELLRLSPAALAVTKKAVYAWDAMHFDKGLARAEKIYLEELMKNGGRAGRHSRLYGEAYAEMGGEVAEQHTHGLRDHA